MLEKNFAFSTGLGPGLPLLPLAGEAMIVHCLRLMLLNIGSGLPHLAVLVSELRSTMPWFWLINPKTLEGVFA